MATPHRAHCLNCGGHKQAVGRISWGGYCGPCGRELAVQNLDAMHDKDGPEWERWRYGMARSLFGDELANALFAAGAFEATPAS